MSGNWEQVSDWQTVPYARIRSPVFEIVKADGHKVVIRDVGPWDAHKTITNGVEAVLRQLTTTGLISRDADGKQRRLFYYDSAGEYSEIVHDGMGGFLTFKPADPLSFSERMALFNKEVKNG